MSKNNLFRRAVLADARKASALGLFRKAVDELETAAAAHRQIAEEAWAVSDEYKNRADDSVQSAVEAEQAAARLREMVGTNG